METNTCDRIAALVPEDHRRQVRHDIANLEQATADATELATDLDEAKARIAQLETQVAALTTERGAEIKAARAPLHEEIATLRTVAAKTLQHNAHLLAQVTELREGCQRREDEARAARQDLRVLARAHASLQVDYDLACEQFGATVHVEAVPNAAPTDRGFTP